MLLLYFFYSDPGTLHAGANMPCQRVCYPDFARLFHPDKE